VKTNLPGFGHETSAYYMKMWTPTSKELCVREIYRI